MSHHDADGDADPKTPAPPVRTPAGESASLPPLPADGGSPVPRHTVSASPLSAQSAAAVGGDGTDSDAEDDAIEVPLAPGDDGQHVVEAEHEHDPNLPYRRTTSMKPVHAPQLGSRTPLELAVTQPAPVVRTDGAEGESDDDEA